MDRGPTSLLDLDVVPPNLDDDSPQSPDSGDHTGTEAIEMKNRGYIIRL